MAYTVTIVTPLDIREEHAQVKGNNMQKCCAIINQKVRAGWIPYQNNSIDITAEREEYFYVWPSIEQVFKNAGWQIYTYDAHCFIREIV